MKPVVIHCRFPATTHFLTIPRYSFFFFSTGRKNAEEENDRESKVTRLEKEKKKDKKGYKYLLERINNFLLRKKNSSISEERFQYRRFLSFVFFLSLINIEREDNEIFYDI